MMSDMESGTIKGRELDSDTYEYVGNGPFIMQDFFRFKNGPFLPLLFVTSFFNFLVLVLVV